MIKPQEETDWGRPEEHFLWALRNMPMIAGVGAVTHPDILREWSKHLWECGFAHRDYLAGLADEDGNIHVSQLPEQIKRMPPPMRGPRHLYNNAAQWAPKDAPDPKPVRLPDIKELTIQENRAMIQQYVDAGWIKEGAHGPVLAEEFDDGDT